MAGRYSLFACRVWARLSQYVACVGLAATTCSQQALACCHLPFCVSACASSRRSANEAGSAAVTCRHASSIKNIIQILYIDDTFTSRARRGGSAASRGFEGLQELED